MINEADLREMTPSERRALARSLADMDPNPVLGIYLARGRRMAVLAGIVVCAVLVGWIIALFLTLHRSFHAEHWKSAWVSFDIILLVGFAATGWAFWRGRQIVIGCLIITGTLLCCDAWFDVFLDLGTSDIWGSVASAALVELPLAFLMFNSARRLIRLAALVAISKPGAPGESGAPPGFPYPVEAALFLPMWKIPLLGPAPRDP